MAVTTLKTLVQKTVLVTGVKPTAAADRIGLGLGTSTARAYPTDNLSSGQFPLPPNPEPEHVGSRQELSAMQMREQMRAAADVVPPTGSAGCPSAPGLTAVRFASPSAPPFSGWRTTTRTAAAGRTREVCLTADPSRVHVPGDLRHDDRLGRDCQSPDRSSDKRITSREVVSAATAGK